MLEFHITHAGRSALASAAVSSEAITVSSVVLTDGETTIVLADIVDSAELGGSVVFRGTAAGKLIGEGTIQIESFDTSDSVYQAKTAAIMFRDTASGVEKVFAVATSGEVEVYKTQFTSASIIFALELEASDAVFVSFEALEANFPPATETSLGAVQLCTYDQINGTGWTLIRDPLTPVVATPYAVETALQGTLGSSYFNGEVDVKDKMSVGQKEYIDYNSGWYLESGTPGGQAFYQLNLGANFDWRRAIGVSGTYSFDFYNEEIGQVESLSGSLKGLAFNRFDNDYVSMIDIFTQKQMFLIQYTGDNWVLRVEATSPDINLRLYMRNTGTADAIQVDAHTVKAQQVVADERVTAGGFTRIRLNPNAYIDNGFGAWIRYDVTLELVGGKLADSMYLMIYGETRYDGVYDSDTGKVTFGETGFSIDQFGTFRYTPQEGEEPPDCYLYYTKPASIEASHAVKAYGHDIMRAHGCLGWVKFRYTNVAIEGEQLFVADSYQMTVELEGSSLRVRFDSPDGASDLRSVLRVSGTETTVNFFEGVASANVFGSGSYTNRTFDVQGVDTASFAFNTAQSFYGFFKVY